MRVLALTLAAFLAGPASRPTSLVAPPTVVILVRHAEKGSQPAQDPPLTEGGSERAKALVGVARDAGVSAIITTQFERTRKTAEPTAIALHITPEVVAAGPAAQHAKAVADQVMKHAGGTVLVVGHSNTIPALVEELSGVAVPPISEPEHSRVYTIALGDEPRMIFTRY
jgi:broad specificity phosphatase PhoE